MNLNVYRNLHFRSLSAQKNNFAKIAKKLLQDIPSMGTIGLHYAVCPGTKRRLDIGNVASIIDKYFSDCLTEYGVIEDDNYKYIPFVSSGFGGLAKEEHVLVTITEIEPRKKTDMRILLDQPDIQQALDNFVYDQGIKGATGVQLSVVDGEVVAEVLIGTAKATPVPEKKTTPAKKGRGGRPAGSKNKPKEPVDVETTTDSSTDVGSGGTTPTPETEAPVPAKETEGKSPSKNLFGETPEESSSTKDSAPETKPAGDEAKPVKKNSIFDA